MLGGIKDGGYKIFGAAASADANKSHKGGYWGKNENGCGGYLVILGILIIILIIIFIVGC